MTDRLWANRPDDAPDSFRCFTVPWHVVAGRLKRDGS